MLICEVKVKVQIFFFNLEAIFHNLFVTITAFLCKCIGVDPTLIYSLEFVDMTDFTILRVDMVLSNGKAVHLVGVWQLFYIGNLAHELTALKIYVLKFIVWVLRRVESEVYRMYQKRCDSLSIQRGCSSSNAACTQMVVFA